MEFLLKMNNQEPILDDKKYNKLIVILSIVIPIIVAALFSVKIPNVEPLRFLPPIYASINALTAVLLIASVDASTVISGIWLTSLFVPFV
mgnify:CR=1 FL=1